MFRRLTLLAMAACAVAALVIPAAASATEWTDNGSPFTGHAVFELEGPMSFNNALIGTDCNQAYLKLTLKGGTDEGEVVAFKVTNPTTQCQGTKLLAACVPENPDPVLPWPVTANANGTITITKVHYTQTFNNCNSSTITPHENNVTATPNNAEAISGLTLSGNVTTPSGAMTLAGTLAATAPETIGIN